MPGTDAARRGALFFTVTPFTVADALLAPLPEAEDVGMFARPDGFLPEAVETYLGGRCCCTCRRSPPAARRGTREASARPGASWRRTRRRIGAILEEARVSRSVRPIRVALSLSLMASAAFAGGSSAAEVRAAASAWRGAHGREIVGELAELVAIPNLASDGEAIRRNAQRLVALLERRGLAVRLLEVEGAPPVVLGTLSSPGATRAVVFYAHYDGQPVTPEEWTDLPWTPVLRAGGLDSERVDLVAPGPLDGEWRLYGRSASDDKGPIIALLAALDALRAAGIDPSINLKVFLEGEEEQGSPHLADVLERFKEELAADLWIFCDGPAHQNRRPQVVFGARGVTRVSLTTYGPAVPLHSGHYGNWAPDPGMLLVQLISSMRTVDGAPRIAGLAELLRPLGPTARAAIAAMPPVEAQLRRDLALGWTEGAPESLPERLLVPAVNLLGFSVGQIGARAANALPSRADAVLGFRLVPDVTPARLRELVERHIRGQGFTIVDHEATPEERLAHGKLVRAEWGRGYPALWTDMDAPVSQAVMRVVEGAVEGAVVKTPTLGGSLPLYLFDEILAVPVIVVPTVNHDNNQHAADENLRLANLFDAVDLFAALFARLGDEWQ